MRRRPTPLPRLGAGGAVLLLTALSAAASVGATRAAVTGGTAAPPITVQLTSPSTFDVPSTPVSRAAAPSPASSRAPSARAPAAQASERALTVPILVYHFIRDANPADVLGVDLSVRPALFAQQMALLAAEGGHPISLAQLFDALRGRAALPAHAVVLTFDDGYRDFATAAAPVLLSHHFTAIDYVVSGFINRPGYMSAAQVVAMDRAGLVMGSHTVDHLDLTHIPAAMAQAEIVGGKRALEQLLGHPVLDFAYPYGGVDAAIAAMAQSAGFRDAVSTMAGTTHTLSARYLLRRIHLGGAAQGLAAFAAAVGLPLPGVRVALVSTASAVAAPPGMVRLRDQSCGGAEAADGVPRRCAAQRNTGSRGYLG